MIDNSDRFVDIRPYNDSEVGSVKNRLINNDEFINVIIRFYKPKLHIFLSNIFVKVFRLFLRFKLSKIKVVRDFQIAIKPMLDNVIKKKTDGFFVTGIENLNNGQTYLFLANHRDIVMDPAFTNYALYVNNFNIPQLAIGDNLLKKQFVSDLMRLNKSFIVKRSATGNKEKLANLKELSSYIKHCLLDLKDSVWLAQSEGRAKDGNDKTETAILKMLHIANRESTLHDMVQTYKIIPVCISYEYDPCDLLKAKELYIRKTTSNYVKSENEDNQSIALGILGYKGKVTLHFCAPVNSDIDDTDKTLASKIDYAINSSYTLYPVNFLALACIKDYIEGEFPNIADFFNEQDILKAQDVWFKKNQACPEEHRVHLVLQYANPVINKFSLKLNIDDVTNVVLGNFS